MSIDLNMGRCEGNTDREEVAGWVGGLSRAMALRHKERYTGLEREKGRREYTLNEYWKFSLTYVSRNVQVPEGKLGQKRSRDVNDGL